MTSAMKEVAPSAADERRAAHRATIDADLWLVEEGTRRVMRCRCVDASAEGMRLRVPVGFGLRPGQTYQLLSSPPTAGSAQATSRQAHVVRTDFRFGEREDWLDVGVRLKGAPQSVSVALSEWAPSAISARRTPVAQRADA